MTTPLTLVAPRRGKPPVHLSDLDLDERRGRLAELGEQAFRAVQVSQHWFGRLEDDPESWSDLPAATASKVREALLPSLLTQVRVLEADAGATRKTLWRLHDGSLVESVLMRYGQPGATSPSTTRAEGGDGARLELGGEDDEADQADPVDDADEAGAGSDREHRRARSTLCVSSQAGCGMGCPFCATGQAGLTRNLSTAEIVEQVLAAARALHRGQVPGGPGRVTNVVFMGMGEPLANYSAVTKAIRRLTDAPPAGYGMSARGITVSTVGLVPAIDRLAAEGLPVTLALSLHAPDDELRNELVPINTRWSVGEALDAARRYFEATGRRVSIEYALIRDVNDQAFRADLLARELNKRGRGWVHVNPIPLNPTPGSRWTASDPRVEREFVSRLRAAGVPTTVRDTRGREIDGACGQLAAVGEGTP
ncbi:MAG: 23S rRNA (adenine(2503)-C(2))-methyltransferase RlmN [Actinomycetales bacterium]